MPPRLSGVKLVLAGWFAVAFSFSHPALAVESPPKGVDHSQEFAGEFSLASAPRLEGSEALSKGIADLVRELKTGDGTQLVINPPSDPVIDTPEFLACYLRTFGGLDKVDGMQSYDYWFERILRRISGTPAMIDDSRLDWDLWRAFLLYESFWDGALYFPVEEKGETSLHALDSAKDLLWTYLDRHGEQIVKTPDRLRWWVDHLTAGLDQPGGRPMRRWFLLQLCALADPTEPQPALDFLQPGGPENLRLPAGDDPFSIVADDLSPPPFAEALEAIIRPLKLTLSVWDIVPAKMPPTRKIDTYLGKGRWPGYPAFILGQESWSDAELEQEEWTVRFSRAVGQRSGHSFVMFPTPNRTDGVFFFVFQQCLYVWPKAKMDAGVIQLLHTAGLIDDARWQQFQSAGIPKLKTTLTR